MLNYQIQPFEPESILNVIWIDENIFNDENTRYYTEIYDIINNKNNEYASFRFLRFQKISEFFIIVQYIKFQTTIIIISGSLYYDFIIEFIKNLNNIYIIPKIIIFANDQFELLGDQKLKNILHNNFYNFGGIHTSYYDIKNFILQQIKSENTQNEIIEDLRSTKSKYENVFIFDYIDCREKLLLPLFYKSLIDSTTEYRNLYFMQLLYQNYSNNNHKLKNLLKSIRLIGDIPNELLSKYYARIYTYESRFYKDMNKDLKNNNNKDFYLPFIKTLYKGVELESLHLVSNSNILYRGTLIENEEIDKLDAYKKQKNFKFTAAIVFSKVFLSFSKDRDLAIRFIPETKNEGLSKVLFVLEKDDNIDFSLSTHADVERISDHPDEKEVLFFPFSSFEIKSIQKILIRDDEEGYQINLLYLGKYLKEFKEDKNFISKQNIIPDSKFKQHLMKSNIIKPEKIQNINNQQIFKNYDNYKIKIENKKENKVEKILEINKENDDSITTIAHIEDNPPKDNPPIIDKEKKCSKCKIFLIVLICLAIGIFLILFFALKKKSGKEPEKINNNNSTDSSTIISDIPNEPTDISTNLNTEISDTPTEPSEITIVTSTQTNIIENNCIEGQCLLINSSLINIMLRWDPDNINDLDISLEGIDKNNNIIDSVYYGKFTGFNGSANLTYNKEDEQEMNEIVSVNLDSIPNNISSIAIIVENIISKDLLSIYGAYIKIYEKLSQKEIHSYSLNKTKSGIFFLYGILERNNNGSWVFREMYESVENQNISFIYNKVLLKEYNISKKYCNGENVLNNENNIDIFYNSTSSIYIGLGWENYVKMIYDLDIILLLFNENNDYIKTVYFNSTDTSGIILSEDNRRGNDIEDDEYMRIYFTLFNNYPNIYSIAVLINNFKGSKLNGLKSAYIRLVLYDISYQCYSLEQDIDGNGLLFGFFKKKNDNYYLFNTNVIPLQINNIKDDSFINQIRQILIYS